MKLRQKSYLLTILLVSLLLYASTFILLLPNLRAAIVSVEQRALGEEKALAIAVDRLFETIPEERRATYARGYLIYDSGGAAFAIGSGDETWAATEPLPPEVEPGRSRWVTQNGRTVPALAFQHIPVDEVSRLFVPCGAKDPNGVLVADFDAFRYYKLADTAHGYFSTVYHSETGGSKEFAAWKQQGDVIAAFFGHTHQDGITGTYDGIELNITYGCEFAKDGPYGMRVITLHEDDVTSYDNQSYTYTDGAFAADPDQQAVKTLSQKISMFFGSLFYVIKTMLRKVVSL